MAKKETENKDYDVFISYRRNGGDVMARLVYLLLTTMGYRVFFDYESISVGRFDEMIAKAIDVSEDFILILSKDMFKDKEPDKDVVVQEIVRAKQQNKNIVPLRMRDYDFLDEERRNEYPPEVREIHLLQAPQIDIGTFSFDFFKRIMTSKPTNLGGVISKYMLQASDEPAVYESIDENIRKRAMKDLLDSILEKDNAAMLYNYISPYLNGNVNQKKAFEYIIKMSSDVTKFKEYFENMERFVLLHERLYYKKKYASGSLPKSFWITFDTMNANLDEHLKVDNVLFSENLGLNAEDMDVLCALSLEQQRDFFERVCRIQLAINNNRLSCENLIFDRGGISAEYKYDDAGAEIEFLVSFDILQERTSHYFFVSINEPTFSPRIRFEYEDGMNVDMVPFFSTNVAVKNTELLDREYNLNIENEWILPMSGAIFVIDAD